MSSSDVQIQSIHGGAHNPVVIPSNSNKIVYPPTTCEYPKQPISNLQMNKVFGGSAKSLSTTGMQLSHGSAMQIRPGGVSTIMQLPVLRPQPYGQYQVNIFDFYELYFS